MTKDKKQSLINELSDIEKLELEAILDRISVQNPEGESFHGWLNSLKNSLSQRQRFVTVLLDTLSKSPTKAGEKVFLALSDCVQDKNLRRVVRKAEYRFEQKGFLKDRSLPQQKVVIFSDKALKNVSLEAREAHLSIYYSIGRCRVSFYLPSITSEGQILVVSSDIGRWVKVLASKTTEPEKLEILLRHGGKNFYKEFTLEPFFTVETIPVTLPFAALVAKELIDTFGSNVHNNIHPMSLTSAQGIIKNFLPEDPYRCILEEIGHSDSRPIPYEESDLIEIAKSIGLFWFRIGKMMETAHSLFSIVDSVLTWDIESKVYNAKRNILNLLYSCDDFHLGLYKLFLIAWAVVLGKQRKSPEKGRLLFEISQDIQDRNFNKWERFILHHLVRSFLEFTTVEEFREKFKRGTANRTSDVISLPSQESQKSRWSLLREFLERV
ncbi:MAG: hypothetical protein N2260_00790 [Syntrophobacterales bacterium]|nr:hypothetical protein [Syntrophobacterales bacterium]